MIDPSFWKNRRVLITGNTGMKGTWMAMWLDYLGATVFGYSLAPPSTPNMFELMYGPENNTFHTGDVRDLEDLRRVIEKTRPELVIHMAAQSLVRESYVDPVTTFTTNVMGTVHVLEATRACSSIRAVICVTSDKCYENIGAKNNFTEDDPLGGHDPYSSSKGCAELAIAAYRNSYFSDDKGPTIASVRAGNVVGGGDWADDRLIPDLIRGILSDQPAIVRNPHGIRPWQHVLDCLSGYLVLASALLEKGDEMCGPWNIGPSDTEAKSAHFIADRIVDLWGTPARWDVAPDAGPHEAGYLSLDCAKANTELHWWPKLELEDALKLTVDWYRCFADGGDVRALTINQISNYAAL